MVIFFTIVIFSSLSLYIRGHRHFLFIYFFGVVKRQKFSISGQRAKPLHRIQSSIFRKLLASRNALDTSWGEYTHVHAHTHACTLTHTCKLCIHCQKIQRPQVENSWSGNEKQKDASLNTWLFFWETWLGFCAGKHSVPGRSSILPNKISPVNMPFPETTTSNLRP